MNLTRKYYSLSFKIISAVIILTGIIWNMIDPWGTHQLTGFAVFMFYTLQSNLLVLGVFIGLIVRDIKDIKLLSNGKTLDHSKTLIYRIQAASVVAIVLTFLVFWALLAPPVFSPDSELKPLSLLYFSNISIHLLSAILMTADFFVFSPRKTIKKTDIYFYLIIPFYYLVFATIAGFAGMVYRTGADGNPVRFPYGFMDYDRSGAMVIPWFVGLALLYFGMSFLLFIIDNKIIKNKQ